MGGNRMRGRAIHRSLVIGVAVASLGLFHATGVEAIGLQTAVTQVPGSAQGPENCPEEVNSNASGIISMYQCAVSVNTNAAPGPVAAGGVWTAGVVLATVTFPTSPSQLPCGTSSGTTGVVSFQYQDAYGSFAFNATMQYSMVGLACVTNYAASFPTSSVKLSSATGIYSLMDEVCGFSLQGASTPPLTLDQFTSAVDFRINNSANGSCTASNT